MASLWGTRGSPLVSGLSSAFSSSASLRLSFRHYAFWFSTSDQFLILVQDLFCPSWIFVFSFSFQWQCHDVCLLFVYMHALASYVLCFTNLHAFRTCSRSFTPLAFFQLWFDCQRVICLAQLCSALCVFIYFISFNLLSFYPTAALIQQATTVRKKDIRKFLDGIYVSEKTTAVEVPED